ncbi:hypothetical protein [Planomicrobium sp. CPCC 101079]|uniref:hypothetical protein n=1 Tax=Planomicrobium sp. CPCC 101079 TaxID=2599618 RepID=UPI002104018E|nr:hypothetical protein [Planomicrobium sp. CPCC 101079]
MKRNETNHVYKIRDLITEDMISHIKLGLSKLSDFNVKEVYADWNFENETGLVIAVSEEGIAEELEIWPEGVDKEDFQNEVIDLSTKGQKAPGSTEIYWLNNRTLLIKRTEIFVQIEKELIKNGFIEELKLAKRPLEYRLIRQSALETILKREIMETFVDWNFEDDKGYMVLILKPQKHDSLD